MLSEVAKCETAAHELLLRSTFKYCLFKDYGQRHFILLYFFNLGNPHGFEVNVKTTMQQNRVDESQEVKPVWSVLNTSHSFI